MNMTESKATTREKALELFLDGQCIPAIPLVLNSEREFDAEGQRRLIRYYLESGVGGIAIAVHTTQFSIRAPEHNLFRPVLEIAAEEISAYEAAKNKTIIRVSGVCGDTVQTVAEARLARELGFDLVLLSTGGRGQDSEEELIDRTRQAAAVMPVIGFSMQTAVGGRLYSPSYWKAITEIPGVAGIKVAPFNRYETISIARAAAFAKRDTPLVLYTGNDDNIIVDLLTPFRFKNEDGNWREIRIKGGLLGQWSVWTRGAVRLFEELKTLRLSGQESIPLELLTRAAWLTEANGAVFDYRHNFAGCIPGVHLALADDGHMDGVWTLDPEEVLSPQQAEEIRRNASDYPVLLD